MQIELLKDNAIEFRGKFCYMWLMVLKPIYKQFIESCICPMLYRKSDVTLLYGTFNCPEILWRQYKQAQQDWT